MKGWGHAAKMWLGSFYLRACTVKKEAWAEVFYKIRIKQPPKECFKECETSVSMRL